MAKIPNSLQNNTKLPFHHSFLIPIQRESKNPNILDWPNKFFSEKDLIKHVESKGNLGIKSEFYPGFDVDIDDPTAAASIIDAIKEINPNCGIRSREGSPRAVVFYNLKDEEEAFPKQTISTKYGKIELLAKGQQFIIHGQHPDGGKYYLSNTKNIQSITQDEYLRIFNALQEQFGIKPQQKTTLTTTNEQTYDELYKTIVEWSSVGARYDALKKLAYMNHKEGVPEAHSIKSLRGLMGSVAESKRDEEWASYMIEGGRLDRLVTDLTRLTTQTVKKRREQNNSEIDVPKMQENLMHSWPEPWPLIARNWERYPREVVQELLIPTILSVHAYLLQARFVTAEMRRPNFFFLNIAPSTAGKDDNSSSVIAGINRNLMRRGMPVTPFAAMLSKGRIITADISFLQEFDEGENLFWNNTEASNIFNQIKNASNNSNVAALSNKLIEVVDGGRISGKIKATKNIKDILDPNVQVLFYAQPETIEDNINESMVDSGLFGRALLSIVPDLKFDAENLTLFKRENDRSIDMDSELIEFYKKSFTSGHIKEKTVLKMTNEQINYLDRGWVKTKVARLIKENEENQSLIKLLRRMGIAGEQLYTLVLAVCQLWDKHNKAQIRTQIDVERLIPQLDYWVDTKLYAVKNLVDSQLDPMWHCVIEKMEDFLSRKIQVKTAKDIKQLKESSLVSRSLITDSIQNSAKLRRKLSVDGNRGDVSVRLERIYSALIKDGKIIEVKVGIRPYFGLAE